MILLKGKIIMKPIIEINNINEKAMTTEDKIVAEVIKSMINPFDNLTVKEVAKDLKMGENLANQVFKRKDFPSVNIGKTKTVMKLAYYVWKMKHREESEDKNDE